VWWTSAGLSSTLFSLPFRPFPVPEAGDEYQDVFEAVKVLLRIEIAAFETGGSQSLPIC